VTCAVPPTPGPRADTGAGSRRRFPHLDHPGWDSNTLESARRWAEAIPGPAYAIDDDTAIAVRDDGGVEVVSEGNWISL
jgi:dipeptidase E